MRARAGWLVLGAVVGCAGEIVGDDRDASGNHEGAPDGDPGWLGDADPIDPAVLHEVDIAIAADDLATFDEQVLRVPCDVRWDGQLLARSACRKKGFIGSVDSVLGKPGFSIDFDDLVPGRTLGPFDRIALNNAIQDPSLVHEHVAYEVFRRLGVPARRTAFAQVRLDGEARGIYVVAEAIDREFLRARFGATNGDGNLYEGTLSIDFVVSPDEMDLKDEEGRSRADLEAAARIVQQASDDTFESQVGAVIDLDSYTRHLAGEILLASHDGYAFGRNNYYLYHRPDTDRFVVLPHGQDQILANPSFDPGYPPAARLAARVRALPALSAAVDAILAEAVAPGGALDPDVLAARIDAAMALVLSTTRTDDFTAGDVAMMTTWAPIVAGRIAWRGSRVRGEVEVGTCGDGVVHALEQCDDGGTVAGDGCDPGCFPECRPITGAGRPWLLCPAARSRDLGARSCADAGATLVVAANADDAATIASIVRRHLGSADVWIGITDEAAEGTWRTDGGAPAPYVAFNEREPSGGTTENCAVLDTGTRGGFRDVRCTARYPALCRVP